MKRTQFLAITLALFFGTASQAAFVIEIDTDGADDGPITFNPNFSFGGDTTTASTSAGSLAIGLNDADSIFGGDGTTVDTYLYSYTPSVDGDNFSPAAGTALNVAGDEASGLVSGGSGLYRVYASWPFTTNVSGGLTRFALGTSEGDGSLFDIQIDQNAGGEGTGEEWIFLGEAVLDASTSYVLTQESGAATFVSMRASGVLFDAVPIPEPAAFMLLAASLGVASMRRRRG